MFKKMFELDKCNTSPRIETITLSDLKQEELEVLLISSIAMAQWFERKGRNMCDHSIVQPTNMSSSTRRTKMSDQSRDEIVHEVRHQILHRRRFDVGAP